MAKSFLRICLSLALAASLHATAAVPLSAMLHDAWAEKEGAPRPVSVMAQTSDGWIWLASAASLTRFDGVRFIPFNAANGTRPQHIITALLPDESGALYIGYSWGGLSVIRGERLEHLSDRDNVKTVYKMAADVDGAIWIAAANGLYRYAGGKLEKLDAAKGYPDQRAEYVHVDIYGRVWAASRSALYLRDAASGRFQLVQPVKSDIMIADAPDGRVWLGRGSDFTQLPAPPPGQPRRPAPTTRHNSFQYGYDSEGNFWAGGCPVGLCRVSAGMLRDQQAFSAEHDGERLDQPWQLASIDVKSLFEDREGNLWVGTALSLERFKQPLVHMVPELMNKGLFVAAPDADGVMWAANKRNMDLELWKIVDGHAIQQPNPHQFSAVGRGFNSLLLAGASRIERRGPDGVTTLPPPPPSKQFNGMRLVQRIQEDRLGLRITLLGEGEYLWRNDAWQLQDYGKLGQPSFSLVDARGRYLQGFRDNVLRITDGATVSEFGPRHGIDVNIIGYIQAEPELLLSGSGGWQIWKDGHFHTLRLESTGQTAVISGIVISQDGARWINSARGLLHVSRQDWERTIANPAVPLRARMLDSQYGYLGGAEYQRREQTAQLGPDGKLWLTSAIGVGWLEPAQLQPYRVPPRVDLLGMRIGERQLRFSEASTLAAGTTQLAIDYAALSYTLPERVQFRYRLHGQDRDWQEVGTRREAIYTNLGPGSYRFEVMATSDDGVQSAPALSPPFTIPPTFTQSGWFKLLLAAVAIALLVLSYRWRITLMQRRFAERTRAQMDERERIARTLHDSFLQNVYGLLLQVQSAIARLPEDEPTRAVLQKALDAGDRALDEGRHQVKGLRQELPEGSAIVDTLRLIAEAAGERGPAITIEGEAPPLDCRVATEVFAIAREALINALRHAGASRIELRFQNDRGTLLVTIRDNGCGIPNGGTDSPPGHYGLLGMRERAAEIGARLSIDSAPGQGTTVTLRRKPSLREKWFPRGR